MINSTEPRAAYLRRAMVDRLVAASVVRTPLVMGALRTVPRHRFLSPNLPPGYVYADQPTLAGDEAASSLGEPPILVANLLEQAQVQPGNHVLLIGAGTGYHAALLDHLVGATGQVTVIDPDYDTVETVRGSLASTGHAAVRVVHTDSQTGYPECAPYERVITAGTVWDVPPWWLQQIAPGGRFTAPVRIRGALTRIISFEQRSDAWPALSIRSSEAAAPDDHLATRLTDDGGVQLHTYPDQVVDTGQLSAALGHLPHTVYTGVTLAITEPIDDLELWLGCTFEHGLTRLVATPAAIREGRIQAPHAWGARAVTSGTDLAYLAWRPVRTMGVGHRLELGVIGHGPAAGHLVRQLADQIRTWADYYRGSPVRVLLQLGSEAPTAPGNTTIHTPRSRLDVEWITTKEPPKTREVSDADRATLGQEAGPNALAATSGPESSRS